MVKAWSRPFQEGKKYVHGISYEKSNCQRWDGSPLCDGEVVKQTYNGPADCSDEKTGGVGDRGGERPEGHLLFERAHKIGAGPQQGIENGQNAGGNRAVEK